MLDALEANLRRAMVYSDIAEIFLFLANLKATKLEIVRGVKLLEAYPDVDPKLTDKLLHFHSVPATNTEPGAYRRASYFSLSH